MQVLKEEVRNRIIDAALDEFLGKGYQNSSLRVIAAHADIVMGNIYRYFTNKEELFNESVGAVHDQIVMISQRVQTEIAGREGPWEDKQAMELVQRMCSRILETFSGHARELLILLNESAGSKYENTKEEMMQQFERILEARVAPEMKLAGTDVKNPRIFHVTASAFVEGIRVILQSCENFAEQRELIGTLANIMLCQISQRI